MAYDTSTYLVTEETEQLTLVGDTNTSRVMKFKASVPALANNIAIGDWVSFDYAKTGTDKLAYVTKQDTSGGAVAIGVPVVGVALNAVVTADDGADIMVCVRGYCAAANVANGSTSGLALALDTTTSGRATIADAANVNICGIALADASGNVAPVMVTGYAL